MQRIIYKTADGGVAVIVPSAEYLSNHTIEELASKDVPAGKTYHIVDASSIPSDRKYRRFWEIKNGMVEVNQTKANQAEAEEIAKEEAGEAIRQSALVKLGITEEEFKALTS